MAQNRHRGPNLPEPRRACLICLLLAALTLVVFWPVFRNGFLKYDDQQYLTQNPHLLGGLTWRNVTWALGSAYASNWHPLTWLSHMLDVQLFGMRPPWHHAVSLVLHVANSILLLLLLHRLTGACWRSAFVAALFATHPLHVESVAWAAERKDVLSTLFFLLTLWAYASYARRPQIERPDPSAREPSSGGGSPLKSRCALQFSRPYLCALILFALGLMSKPMVVTLPFVLLLLDFWPLKRLDLPSPETPLRRVLPLVWEKVPFFAFALGSCIVTFLVQQQTHAMVRGLPLSLRLANAVASYWKYLAKTFWPAGLAVFYPHPDAGYFSAQNQPNQSLSEQWPLWAILLGAVGLALVTLVVVRRRGQAPWWTLGWFWFLGMLVPVLGVVQVGSQAMADRYTYVPLIGIFIGISWSAARFVTVRALGWTAPAAAAVALGACAILTRQQVRYWHDNLTLFGHALKVTSRNAVAEANVGASLCEQGHFEQGTSHLRAAVAADPQYPDGHLYLGIALAFQGHLEEALVEYQAALALRPWDEPTRLYLARTLQLRGQPLEAAAQYQELLRLNPDHVEALIQLGSIRMSQGDLVASATHFERAVRLKPDYTEALIELGRVEAGLGRFTNAEQRFGQALALNPTNANLHLNLANALMLGGQADAARNSFAQALRLDPDLPAKFLREGKSFAARGNLNTALARFKTAWWLKPDDAEIQENLAWMLATHPQSNARDGAQAVRLAQRALENSGGQEPRYWAALDAAYAEAGRFSEAIGAAEKARDLARATGQAEDAQAAENRLALYRRGQPYHQ